MSNPVSKIRERLNLPKLVEENAVTIPLSIPVPGEADEYFIPKGYGYFMNSDGLRNLVDAVISHTYEETFAMLKRQIAFKENE
ncbi:MAG: hypothetical protein ACR2IJ_04850 [Fluviibacter sp.]